MGSTQRSIAPTKVAIYIRWSTEDQTEGTTLDVQTEGCSHFLKSQGWVVNPDLVFIDDGYSGGNLDRPALAKMRKQIIGGKIDCVVTFKIDRLSRNVVDTVNLVLREWENRCYFKSAREAIDTSDPAGKMFFYTLVSFAEWERTTIRDRTFSGRLRRAQEGRNPGRKFPYGFALGEKGTVTVVPEHASIVNRIYQEYISGASARGIAMKLNQQGIPGPGVKGWSFGTVSRILTYELYTGKFIWGSVTRMPKDRPARTPREVTNEKPLVVLDDALPQIVTREVFDMAQAVKRGRPSPKKGEGGGRAHSSKYLLTGLLVCGLCGSKIQTRPPYKASTAYYYCWTSNNRGATICDSSYIKQQELDLMVIAELKRVYGDATRRTAYIAQYVDRFSKELETVKTALQRTEAQLRSLEDEEAVVRKHFRQQGLTLQEYRQMTDDLTGDREVLSLQEKALREQVQDLQASVGGHGYYLHAASQIDHWENLDLLEQKRLVRMFVKEVRAHRRRNSDQIVCEVTWMSEEIRSGCTGELQADRPYPEERLVGDPQQ